MTDQTTPPTTPTPPPAPTSTPTTPTAPEVAPLADDSARRGGEATGYALYDLAELRFVGDVHSTKAKAEKGYARKVKGRKYEVREV